MGVSEAVATSIVNYILTADTIVSIILFVTALLFGGVDAKLPLYGKLFKILIILSFRRTYGRGAHQGVPGALDGSADGPKRRAGPVQPFNTLDQESIEALISFIEASPGACVLVAHRPPEALRMDRVIDIRTFVRSDASSAREHAWEGDRTS
ncbi:circular bacteriocin, circularin A/uberolysin family [Hydrogenibacillus sp. N12]|uniref:uberolysin/carnocyclin family circular bacteriocin n=1 Tax=Hydrogenibacillus sp. N12 TaxID=2866627 RepID=UPI00207BD42A|nr:circular bacteriocin, circularin A/uberolysin family [Hydrogenibacillus sp. N12]